MWVLIEYEKTFGYLGRVPGIYFGLRAGSSFPIFEVFGLRVGIAKFASDGRAGGPRLGLDTSLLSESNQPDILFIYLCKAPNH